MRELTGKEEAKKIAKGGETVLNNALRGILLNSESKLQPSRRSYTERLRREKVSLSSMGVIKSPCFERRLFRPKTNSPNASSAVTDIGWAGLLAPWTIN